MRFTLSVHPSGVEMINHGFYVCCGYLSLQWLYPNKFIGFSQLEILFMMHDVIICKKAMVMKVYPHGIVGWSKPRNTRLGNLFLEHVFNSIHLYHQLEMNYREHMVGWWCCHLMTNHTIVVIGCHYKQ